MSKDERMKAKELLNEAKRRSDGGSEREKKTFWKI